MGGRHNISRLIEILGPAHCRGGYFFSLERKEAKVQERGDASALRPDSRLAPSFGWAGAFLGWVSFLFVVLIACVACRWVDSPRRRCAGRALSSPVAERGRWEPGLWSGGITNFGKWFGKSGDTVLSVSAGICGV